MVVIVVDGRYVCWDNFKVRWYLGPRRLSEKFYFKGSRLEKVLDLFKTAHLRWA